MLEKRYTLPVLFGICLGIIMAGVQISATALNAAVGPERNISLVVFENVDRNGIDMLALGKRLSIKLPPLDRPEELARTSKEAALGIYGRCREKAVLTGGELPGLIKSGREKAGELRRRWDLLR